MEMDVAAAAAVHALVDRRETRMHLFCRLTRLCLRTHRMSISVQPCLAEANLLRIGTLTSVLTGKPEPFPRRQCLKQRLLWMQLQR